MKKLYKLSIVLLLVVGLNACSDFLNPSTKQNKTVESIDGIRDLEALIIGAHDGLSQLPLYGGNFILFGEVRTPNAFVNRRAMTEVALFNYLPSSGYSLGAWDAAYEAIAICNLIINSDVEQSAEVDQVKGQAYAIRALAHMILLELYGQQNVDGSDMGIPYVTKYLGDDQSFPTRLTVQETYGKIGNDFKKAVGLLDPSIVTPATRINYYAALALQARYYMFVEDYAKAAAAAEKVINSNLYSLVPASQYLKAWGTDGQPSFIFGIAMTETDNIPIDGIYSKLNQQEASDFFAYGNVEITKKLYSLFGGSDVRKGLYTIYPNDVRPEGRLKYRATGKYPDPNTNIPVVRYAEVVLTYAEAKARLNEPVVALTYLNKIPAHRNANSYTAADGLIDSILLERRKELAMEGHYFWTLMRTKQDIVRTGMRPVVGNQEVTIPYGDHRLAFPIPDDEINANPNMKQNAGYGGS